MFIFALSIGVATFIENDFGTPTARALIYNAKWFEVLLVLTALNLLYNIFRAKLYRKEKFLVGLFHFSFIILLVGSALTRYFSFEGTMHIREGESSNIITSDRGFITLEVMHAGKKLHYEEPIYLSTITKNSFDRSFNIADEKVRIKLADYIPHAAYQVKPTPDGKPILSLMIATSGEPITKHLQYGELLDFGDKVLSFGAPSNGKPTMAVTLEDDAFYIVSDKNISTLSMDTQEQSAFVAHERYALTKRTLLMLEGVSLAIKDIQKSAVVEALASQNEMLEDMLIFDVTLGTTHQELVVLGSTQSVAKPSEHTFGASRVALGYGTKEIELPFSIKLNDFELTRYAGSMSPSSYASEVTLIDEKFRKEFRIYMNHVLDYKGYRFFQTSYDPDELGTVLSVNHDNGALLTYFGYILLAIGMLLHLFTKKSRFQKLRQKVRSLQHEKLAILLSVVMLSTQTLKAEDATSLLDTIKSFNSPSCEKFGELLYQSHDGRVAPIDTLSREVLAKLSGKKELFGLTPNQVMVSMMVKPQLWQKVTMIKVKNKELKKLLGMSPSDTHADFNSFFKGGEYLLARIVEEANRKKPSRRSKLDNSAIKVDEKLNIAYLVYSGALFAIFPSQGANDKKWYATTDALQRFDANSSQVVRNIISGYILGVEKGVEKGDWKLANLSLEALQGYQLTHGKAVIPPQSYIDMELLYNKVDIFENLTLPLLLVGVALLILSFVQLLQERQKRGDRVFVLFKSLVVVLFVLDTVGLMLRWYIAGHAPWSNGYESMIYIGWAVLLAGFIFSKKSPMILALTTLLTGIIMFVAHLSWMDPQITNLVPVLKSYWLTIHVSMITASYGFLGLASLVSFVVLVIYLMLNDTNMPRLSLSMRELTAISEMSMIIGLVLLTIGNFLGGVWANESWGRYWGWDPKETWAMVTILVYAVVLHLRMIPKMRTLYNYNVSSVFALFSIIMTYFGVNYYLSGMHSYAKGDPVPIPFWVYPTVSVIVVVALLALFKARGRVIDLD